MREIKFRVYDTEKKKLSYGFSIRSLAEEMVQPVIESHVDNLIWQQYTGLKDKNGVEIYEGDLIKGHNLPIGDNPAEVCWSQNSLSYQVDGKFCGCELSKLDAKSIVVVGNVYEGVDK